MQQQNQMTRDEFNKAHVACIVLGTDDIPSTDELIEKNYAFGKWIDLEADERTWNTKIKELQEALKKTQLQQKIKGIKFILDRHGDKDLTLIANNTSIDYKSRLEQVASIINSELNKNKERKVYFKNLACYGAHNIKDKNNKVISIHEILTNEFQKSGNVDRVYCHNVIPGLGVLTTRNLDDENYFIHTPYYVSPNGAPTMIHCMTSDVAYMRDETCMRQYGKYVASEADKSVYPFRVHAPDCFLYFPLRESKCLNNNFPLKESECLNNETLRKFNKEEKDKFLGWGKKRCPFKSILHEALNDSDRKDDELILKVKKNIANEEHRCYEFATKQFNEENKKKKTEAEHKLNNKLWNAGYKKYYFCPIQ